jgi:hypothetical protein
MDDSLTMNRLPTSLEYHHLLIELACGVVVCSVSFAALFNESLLFSNIFYSTSRNMVRQKAGGELIL